MKKIFTVPSLYVWIGFTIYWFAKGDFHLAVGSIYGGIMLFLVFWQIKHEEELTK